MDKEEGQGRAAGESGAVCENCAHISDPNPPLEGKEGSGLKVRANPPNTHTSPLQGP